MCLCRGRTWDLLVQIYFHCLKQRFGPLGYCAPYLLLNFNSWRASSTLSIRSVMLTVAFMRAILGWMQSNSLTNLVTRQLNRQESSLWKLSHFNIWSALTLSWNVVRRSKNFLLLGFSLKKYYNTVYVKSNLKHHSLNLKVSNELCSPAL